MMESGPLAEAGVVVLRLGVATMLGGALGLNRGLHRKPAGLRTHALVALGSALATYLGLAISATGQEIDPHAAARVIQGVITGVGFLGAGVILREEGEEGETRVKGLTTAATIWVVACLGIACGSGHWLPAAVAFGITLAVFRYGRSIEDALQRRLAPTDDAPPGPPPASGPDSPS